MVVTIILVCGGPGCDVGGPGDGIFVFIAVVQKWLSSIATNSNDVGMSDC